MLDGKVLCLSSTADGIYEYEDTDCKIRASQHDVGTLRLRYVSYTCPDDELMQFAGNIFEIQGRQGYALYRVKSWAYSPYSNGYYWTYLIKARHVELSDL